MHFHAMASYTRPIFLLGGCIAVCVISFVFLQVENETKEVLAKIDDQQEKTLYSLDSLNIARERHEKEHTKLREEFLSYINVNNLVQNPEPNLKSLLDRMAAMETEIVELRKLTSSLPSQEKTFKVRKRTTPSWDTVLSKFLAMQAEGIASTDPNRKYVIAKANGSGMANRMQGIVGTFLFALLTNRIFLLDWRAGTTQLSKSKANDEGTAKIFDIDAFFSIPFDWSIDNLPEDSTIKEYSLDYGASTYSKLLCGDLNENFPEKVVQFSTWDYFGIFMSHNVNYRDIIADWFGSPDNLYEPIAHFLWQPKSELQRHIDSFVENNFRPYTVGLHIRTKGNRGWVMKKEHLDAAFQCAGISFGDGISPPGQSSIVNQTLNGGKAGVFLAADSPENIAIAKNLFGDHLITFEGSIDRTSESGLQQAIMEMWILARCDDLVLSYQSSFSRNAAALAKILPLVVTHDGKCMREVSNEPCSCAWVHALDLKCYDPILHNTPYSVNQVGCYTCDGMSRWQNHANH